MATRRPPGPGRLVRTPDPRDRAADRPSPALTLASWCCPLGVFYSITNILVARPGTEESADPLAAFLVTVVAFGFTVAAMLVPLLSEFDVALGRTTAAQE